MAKYSTLTPSKGISTLHLKKMICVGALAAGALATTGVASASAATITEAGSSLVYPVASVWASHYSANTVNTRAGGSGAGIAAVTAGQVDIGASDAPMTPGQYGSGSYVQIPWGLSATGIGYNLPGISTGLKLTGNILAEIYTGKITSWGDPQITKLNPTLAGKLKGEGTITPVFRSDGSGDSYAFQNYLSHAAGKVWTFGFSTSFPGTAGVGENGNAGVAGEVKSNKGTIGYISGAYLLQQHLSVAAIRNNAGKYEFPNIASILNAAASNTSISPQGANFTGLSIVNPSSKYKTAYPISTFTYAIVSMSDKNLPNVQDFLSWVVNPKEGQEYGVSLDFAPLPAAVRSIDAGLINSL
jgi:phosphate transport system substrate-binding protein